MPSTTSVSLKRIKRSGRNGRFRYDWTLRWFQTDGIERSEKIGDASTMSKREAERIRRDFQAKMDAGAAPRDRPREMTLEQFVEFHDLRIIPMGGDRTVYFHLVMPKGADIDETCKLCARFEDDIRKEFPELEVSIRLDQPK